MSRLASRTERRDDLALTVLTLAVPPIEDGQAPGRRSPHFLNATLRALEEAQRHLTDEDPPRGCLVLVVRGGVPVCIAKIPSNRACASQEPITVFRRG